MSLFDIIVFLVLLGSFVKGIKKGLTMQFAGLVAVVAGVIFAGKVADILLPFLLNSVNVSSNIAVVLSYALAFIIIFAGIYFFLGKALHFFFKALHIGFINKILGSLLGVFSTSLVLSVLLNLVVMLDSEENIITENLKAETFFYSKIQKVAPIIVPYLKEEVWEKHIQDRIKHHDEEDREGKQNASSTFSKAKYRKL